MLKGHLEQVLKQIEIASKMAQRSPQEIRLLPVTKTQPPQVIRQAYDLGLRNFAENYVEELISKAKELSDLPAISWTFIGQLQSNKIKKLVEHAAEIQTVASQKHADYINRYAIEYQKQHFSVWICVNAANEPTKSGITLNDAIPLAKYIQTKCPQLSLQGIMAIPPSDLNDQSYSPQNTPQLYKTLKSLAVQIGKGKLSLGMTSDLNIAIASGTDCVRIGTAIFGDRSP